MFGPRLVRAFEEVKDRFDPDGRLNPGRIVRAPRMDDRRLFRYPPGYAYDGDAARLRLVGLAGRAARRGRDVQQQRRLPEAGRRRHVPELPGDAERARRDAGARQYRCGWR